MKRDMSNPKNIKEEILNDLTKKLNAPEIDESPPGDIPQKALDDSRRIKVLSPGMLVFKRFMRSKLAIAGSIILIFMFSFAFLGGIISPFQQQEVFHKYDEMELDFAQATVRENYSSIIIDNTVHADSNVVASLNSIIKTFEEDEISKRLKDTSGNEYLLEKMGEKVFVLKMIEFSSVANYSLISRQYAFLEDIYNLQAFKDAVETLDPSHIPETLPSYFSYADKDFRVSRKLKTCNIEIASEPMLALFSTNFVFDSYGVLVENDILFRYEALKALYGAKEFDFNELSYTIVEDVEVGGVYAIYRVDALDVPETEGIDDIEEQDLLVPVYNMSNFVVRQYTGEDTLPIEYKKQLQSFIAGLIQEEKVKGEFRFLEETEEGTVNNYFKVERKLDNYIVRNNRITYLIDIYSKPASNHWLGTDGNGMDVLTRMMYGGRISLLIGFIVIFLETLLGVVLGGLAGYFGKWVDNFIMRLVDIFNCIPFLPIMIILGSVFDKLQLGSYERIIWLMVLMGILGWPGIARLVRGQILSLREQEFMLAAEATGISASRKIFRHLVPNVMPQLIVNATMGLGSIIITESTLSFLGLGAKYPLATWGSMINSVSDASALVNYTYIWIPVGVLICLTVIAFNFVGDGLRDAFDPKMKR